MTKEKELDCIRIWDIVVSAFAVIILVISVFLLSVGVANFLWIAPYASDNANTQCIERGFDYAYSWNNGWFDSHALGVKCANYNSTNDYILGQR